MLLHSPEWARSCDNCAKWLYDEDGRIARRPARVGEPVRRLPGQPTPCHKCPKIPDDAPAKARQYAVELTEQNLEAYEHYTECRAVGRFPEDGIVGRNAALIRMLEDARERSQVLGRLETLIGLFSLGVRRG